MEQLDAPVQVKDKGKFSTNFVYALSQLCERASYYGLRALLILYMTDEALKMERQEALELYGWFAAGVVFFELIGGLLGDFIIGHRRSLILGGVIQLIGAILIGIGSLSFLYAGMAIFCLGSGLYRPNLFASFSKQYLNKDCWLDKGFLGLMLAINLGAFIGTLSIGYIGETISYHLGFLTAAGFSLIAILLPLLFTQEIDITESSYRITKKSLKRVGLCLLLLIVYIAIAEVNLTKSHLLAYNFDELLVWDFPRSLLQSLGPIITLLVTLLFFIFWRINSTSNLRKIIVSLCLSTVALVFIYLFPEGLSTSLIPIFFIAILFISISEVLMFPVIYSLIIKYANPKYLATWMSLIWIPFRIAAVITSGIFALELG